LKRYLAENSDDVQYINITSWNANLAFLVRKLDCVNMIAVFAWPSTLGVSSGAVDRTAIGNQWCAARARLTWLPLKVIGPWGISTTAVV
jgi:hypothetical protein